MGDHGHEDLESSNDGDGHSSHQPMVVIRREKLKATGGRWKAKIIVKLDLTLTGSGCDFFIAKLHVELDRMSTIICSPVALDYILDHYLSTSSSMNTQLHPGRNSSGMLLETNAHASAIGKMNYTFKKGL